MYRPGRALAKAVVPTLVAVCSRDSVAPARATLRHASRASGQVETISYPYGHFDIYDGSERDHVLSDQLVFLRRVFGESR